MNSVRHLARIRILLARRPWIVWVATSLASLLLVAMVRRPVAEAASARAQWGDTRTVMVAGRAVPAGTPVAEAGLVARAMPLGLLPDHALTEVAAGAVVVRALERGEVVVAADVGRGDPRFALVPVGHVVVAVPRPDAMVPAQPGDQVTITPPAATGFTADRPEHPTAIDAVVVDLTPAMVLVAVAPQHADEVAGAVGSSDPFAFVLRGGPATVESP